MVEFETKAEKWGSSIRCMIPKEIIKKFNIKPNENIIIEIKIDR